MALQQIFKHWYESSGKESAACNENGVGMPAFFWLSSPFRLDFAANSRPFICYCCFSWIEPWRTEGRRLDSIEISRELGDALKAPKRGFNIDISRHNSGCRSDLVLVDFIAFSETIGALYAGRHLARTLTEAASSCPWNSLTRK